MLNPNSKKYKPQLPVKIQLLIKVELKYLKKENNNNKKLKTVYKICEMRTMEIKVITVLFK